MILSWAIAKKTRSPSCRYFVLLNFSIRWLKNWSTDVRGSLMLYTSSSKVLTNAEQSIPDFVSPPHRYGEPNQSSIKEYNLTLVTLSAGTCSISAYFACSTLGFLIGAVLKLPSVRTTLSPYLVLDFEPLLEAQPKMITMAKDRK